MSKVYILVKEFQDIIHGQENGYVASAEAVLANIVELHDPCSIAPLIKCFNDKEMYDELMFSIIHSIEIFDDVTYVREVIGSLPDFITRAPRWCSIVHMRILNSPPTLAAYIVEAKGLNAATKSMLRKILVQMGAQGKAIAEKTVPLLKALQV